MSRFSKAEAERRGWVFVHDAKEVVEQVGSFTRIKPASVRAEKYVEGELVNEEAETIGKLLERIHAYEAHRDGLPDATPALPEPDAEAPKVTYDPTVPQGENPLVPVEEPAPGAAPEA